jgi:hypothetical protein
MDIDDLACAAFDFLTPVVRTNKAGPELVIDGSGTRVMDGIVGVVLNYTQITRDNVRETSCEGTEG